MDTFDTYSAKSPNDLSRVDSYDRESYNSRERDPYRERRRSPNSDRRARQAGRNRSRSPTQIDRYQPDRSRDDYYRGREDYTRDRRRSSPQIQPGAPKNIDRYIPGDDAALPRAIPVNQLRDPLLEASQVGFSYFAEWWKAEQEIKQQRERQKNGGRRPEPVKESRDEQRAKIQNAYDQYKLNWNTRMAKLFVHGHKYDTWFRERYVPEVRDPLRQKVLEFRRDLFARWDSDLTAGTFDEFTLEGIYKSESNGAGGIVEKEEGETSAAAEVLAVSDLLPSKGGDVRDPVAFQPTLLVKTITPAVSRERMEEFCKEHLGEGEGGYKWLSLSDPNPGKKFHRLGWIMLNPASDVPEEDTKRRGSRDDDDQDADGGAMDEDKPNHTQTICERALNEINNKTIQDPEKGDFTVHVGIHHPQENPRKKALWDLFSAPERVERDLDLALRLVRKLDSEMGDDYDGVGKIEQRVDELAGKGYLQPPIPAPKVVKDEDVDDGEMEEGEEDEGGIDEDVDDEELLIKKKKLDLLVEYLRRVYNFCFYCVFECDSVHELQRKCAGGHLRRPRASLTSAAKETARATANGEPFPLKRQESGAGDGEDGSPVEERKSAPRAYGKNQLQKAYNWVKTFEEKLLMILEPYNVDLRKLGGKPVEEGLEEDMSKFVKQEDEFKFRCKVPECTKLFKGENFWKKHVEKRHQDWYDKLKEDIELVNRYVLDPARLAQGRNDASSNGHFPVNNNMPTGTPRNFSLNNMPFFNNGMPMPGAGGPAGFNPFVPGQFPLTMPGWNMQGGDRGAGPMRTGGMRTTNARAPGPYDRGMRVEPRRSISGRLTPPRRGMFMEGGEHTVGPRQAVEGRTMKSYNDLDAAGSAGGAEELNY
ncbi:hypothetical protein KCU95_g17936, partial [Aureobasidium melanogenum]